MKANDIFAEARAVHVRELKKSLSETRSQLVKVQAECDVYRAHFALGLEALHDFESLPPGVNLRIIDGWNAILGGRNVSKIASEDISRMKKEYLSGYGICEAEVDVTKLPPVTTWIVFDGKTPNSYRAGAFRVTYTGGTGAHRADRLIMDFVNTVKMLGMDVSKIVVETADRDMLKRIESYGARVEKTHAKSNI